MTARRVSSLFIIIVFLGLARTLAAQVRGTVVDATNVPVAGVSVFLADSTEHVFGRALTDGQGSFRFSTVAPGRYLLRTMRIGFRPTRGPLFAVGAAQESVRGPVEFASHVPPGKMMLPGAIVFTRTLLAPTSFASSFDRWFIAAFDVP